MKLSFSGFPLHSAAFGFLAVTH